MVEGRPGYWQDLLCCPVCHEVFKKDASSWTCQGCGLGFPLAGALPVLLSPEDRHRFSAALTNESGERMQSQYDRRERSDIGAKLYRAFAPPFPVYVNPEAPPLPGSESGINLWLGAGGLHTGNWINLDIGAFPGVDVIANAGRVPFLKDSCDRVACLALLEHVEDPQRVVMEIHRVLKPGGLVDAVVPFCHPYHPFPLDYQRFSRDGLRKLFEAFESVEIGIRTGPTTTILTFLTYYWKLIFPVHTPNRLRRWLNRGLLGVWGWTTAPLSRVDRFLNHSPDAHVLANHFYVRARKR